ncbi:MAG TPA: hypothetical protein PLN52_02845 [Opitutaceae bacterium]|nr:hypothetical protein [Opitutaceae bacterium]
MYSWRGQLGSAAAKVQASFRFNRQGSEQGRIKLGELRVGKTADAPIEIPLPQRAAAWQPWAWEVLTARMISAQVPFVFSTDLLSGYGSSRGPRAAFDFRLSAWLWRIRRLQFVFIAILLLSGVGGRVGAATLAPKVVVVTMFEPGDDTGDVPGEFQLWVEREALDRVIPFPQGFRDLRTNADGSVLAIVTGIGTARSAASIMALGSDPRFDLRQSYWLIAGIAGIDPRDGTIGSAAWAEWIVDGDLAHEIDPREAPPEWSTGYLPLRKSKPTSSPVPRKIRVRSFV